MSKTSRRPRPKRTLRIAIVLCVVLGTWQLGPRPPLPVCRYLGDSNVAGALVNLDPGQVSIVTDLLVRATPTDNKDKARGATWVRLLFPILAPVQVGALLESRNEPARDPGWVIVARPRRLPSLLRVWLKRTAKDRGLVFRERGGYFLLSQEEPNKASVRPRTNRSPEGRPTPGLSLWLRDGEALGRFLSDLLAPKSPELDPELGAHLLGKIQGIDASFRLKSSSELDGQLILSSTDPLDLGVYRFFLLACRDLLQENLEPKGATVSVDLMDAPGKVLILLDLKGTPDLFQKGGSS